MNFNNFKGGLCDAKSLYQIGSSELIKISNLDVEQGGLKLRAGTKRKYGPLSGEIKNLKRAIDSNNNEYIFIDTTDSVKVIINGTMAEFSGSSAGDTQIIHGTNGFKFKIGSYLYTPENFYVRQKGTVTSSFSPSTTEYVFFLNVLDSDYYTDGYFPANLKGKVIINPQTGYLYSGLADTNANPSNIYSLLENTSLFKRHGKIGTWAKVKPVANHLTGSLIHSMDLGDYDDYKLSSVNLTYIDIFVSANFPPGASEALKCKYIVWHPSSMRYFAAGHPTNKCALYVSEPNDLTHFNSGNILYPHLSMGKITSLNIVERSVLVGYEYGWSHYIGSDPTTDAQWSLLSIPDGCKLGKTIQTTPNSITYYSDNGIVLFSTAILTVQSIFTPSTTLFKYVSANEIKIEGDIINSFYNNGKYYLFTSGKTYIYDFNLSSFSVYGGLNAVSAIVGFNGEILLANKNYIVEFSSEAHTDFDPVSGNNVTVSFEAVLPVVNICRENEIGQITDISVKCLGINNLENAAFSLESEAGEREFNLFEPRFISFRADGLGTELFDGKISESYFDVGLPGNIFFISFSGNSKTADSGGFMLYNIFLGTKKERNKIC